MPNPLVILQRLPSGDSGTFGQFIYLGKKFFTGELPWKNNQQTFSCIPPGTYTCVYGWSTHLKRFVYKILNVPGRVNCEIHNGNFCGDTTLVNPETNLPYVSSVLGCIVVGLRIGSLEGQDAVLDSVVALTNFEKLMNKQPFDLQILAA